MLKYYFQIDFAEYLPPLKFVSCQLLKFTAKGDAMKNQNSKYVKQRLTAEEFDDAMSYDDYRKLVRRLVSDGKSIGPKQTEALAHYTQLNDRRVKRFDKTVKIDAETVSKIESITEKITLLVLTES